jgi:hypothetical protein
MVVAKWIASLLNSAPKFRALSLAGGYDLKMLQPFLEALQTYIFLSIPFL